MSVKYHGDEDQDCTEIIPKNPRVNRVQKFPVGDVKRRCSTLPSPGTSRKQPCDYLPSSMGHQA